MSRRDEQREKNRKRWGQIAIGLFIILLMVLSIVQFADNGDGSQQLEFNGYKFTQEQNGLSVKADGKRYAVETFPAGQNGSTYYFQTVYGTSEIVAAPGVAATLRNASLIVFAFDPLVGQPGIQLVDYSRLSIVQQVPNVIGAVTQNSSSYASLQVIGCDQAQGAVTVIRFLVVNQTENVATVHLDGRCLTVEASPPAVLAAKDYLLLSYAGVIPDAS